MKESLSLPHCPCRLLSFLWSGDRSHLFSPSEAFGSSPTWLSVSSSSLNACCQGVSLSRPLALEENVPLHPELRAASPEFLSPEPQNCVLPQPGPPFQSEGQVSGPTQPSSVSRHHAHSAWESTARRGVSVSLPIIVQRLQIQGPFSDPVLIN